MFFVFVLVVLLFVVLIFVGQSASDQKRRKHRNALSQDAGSEPSILSIDPTHDIRPALSVPEVTYVDPSIDNFANHNIGNVVNVDNVDYGSSGDFGGVLGSAVADSIDGAGGSSGAFDGGDFGGSGDFGGGTIDGSNS